MIAVLIDHNAEGHAALLWTILVAEGWTELAAFRFVTFKQAGLAYNSSDRIVWRFAQAHHMLLLTGNRRSEEEDSLEQTIREENYPTALPVVTISDVRRMVNRAYRSACATRLAEIALDLDNFRGAGRLYIP